MELVTQAFIKIPCVNTEKSMGTQDNFNQSKQGCCKWETLVDTENSLCIQGNLCIDTTFLDWQKLCGVQKVFNCVLTQGFLCKLVSWVLF